MGYRRDPFAVDEWYHCYNRGIDKRVVFESERDCERFVEALYLCNDDESTERSYFDHIPHNEIFERDRSSPLVAIGAYCLMPTHYHLLLREIVDNGISRFMHKLGTSYAMYFNTKNARTGNLFNKPFRSRHVSDDRYFRHVAQYIHLNPAETFEKDWKEGKVSSLSKLEHKMREYRFSSFQDYYRADRVEYEILDVDAISIIRNGMPPMRNILREAHAYYQKLP